MLHGPQRNFLEVQCLGFNMNATLDLLTPAVSYLCICGPWISTSHMSNPLQWDSLPIFGLYIEHSAY